MVTRFISKGKGRKRKSIPITPKKKRVTVRSVSLEPQAIQKINKKTIKTLNRGESANFSSSLNKIVISSRLKRDSSFEDSGIVVGQAKWTGHGRGFGHSYGWQIPDGAFVSIDKRNITESIRPKGGMSISSGKFKGKMIDLHNGKIFFEDFKGRCNFCGARGFDTRKGCPNNCGKILRDEKGEITGVVGV